MKIKTATLGEVEAYPESFITLQEGLIGFEDHNEFVLLELADYEPFRWLLSYTDPGLSFPLLDPKPLIPGYEIKLQESEKQLLGLEENEEPKIYVIASIDDEGNQVTVNLRAPLIVNARNQRARQVVLSDGRWEIQHPLLKRTDSSVEV